jgi:hypothetical protein
VLVVEEHACGTIGVLVEQEDDAGDTALLSRSVLELGVGEVTEIPHRRAVAESGDEDVEVGVLHGGPALRCRRRGIRGEIRHVGDRVAGADHRGLGRGHERQLVGELTELRGVRKKNSARPHAFVHAWPP